MKILRINCLFPHCLFVFFQISGIFLDWKIIPVTVQTKQKFAFKMEMDSGSSIIIYFHKDYI